MKHAIQGQPHDPASTRLILPGSGPRPIVVFDGVCHLCSKTVDFILKRERGERFLFASNQSAAGRELLERNGVGADSGRSIWFIEPDSVTSKSTAVLRILKHCRFPWNLLSGLLVIPAALRDRAYDVIAMNRYRWFGKYDACRLPSSKDRARFLDLG